MQIKRLAAAIALATISCQTMASTFNAVEPRALGMGGIGAATADATNAHYYNPALLATKQKTKLFTVDAAFAALLTDPGNMAGAVTDFNSGNYISNFTTALTNLNATLPVGLPTPAEIIAIDAARAQVVIATNELNAGIKTMSAKPVLVGANLGGSLAIPNKTYSMAGYYSAWGEIGAVFTFSNADETFLTNTADALGTLDSSTATTADSLATATFTSDLRLAAVTVKEYGASIAKKQTVKGHDFVWGVTPKLQTVGVIAQKFAGDQLDNANTTNVLGSEVSSTGANIDVGLLKHFDKGLRAGLTIKNLLPMSYDAPAAFGGKVKIGPAFRLGGAFKSKRLMAGIDMDLLPNDALLGSEGASQFLAVGAELDLWILKARTGYRLDLQNADASIATAGLGFNFFLAHVDLGAGVNTADPLRGLNLSAQVGVNW